MTAETGSAGDGRGVLVTGAGGFIGRHLVADQLARGRRVVALDLDVRAVEPLRSPRLTTVEGDVGDAGLLATATTGVHTLFHLAAAHLSVSTPPAEFERVNVAAVRTLIDVATAAGVSRFVHCSTVGVYGALETQPADEETPCHPEFAYERTKLEAESSLLEAHRTADFPVVILRPAWVYGPGCPRTDKLFRAIRKGRFPVAGGGGTLRHGLYIRDAVRAFELAATAAEVLGEVIILADGRAETVRFLVDEIARTVGARRPPTVPRLALYAAGLCVEALFRLARAEPPLSRRSLRFFTGNTSFRTDKAKDRLGFEATYTLAEGIAETHRIRERSEFWQVPLSPPREQV